MRKYASMAFIIILISCLLMAGYIAGKHHTIYDAAIWHDNEGYSYLEIDNEIHIYSMEEK